MSCGELRGFGTILTGESFEVTLTPKADGALVYLPAEKTVTITWDGVWINQVLAITDLPGFKAIEQMVVVEFNVSIGNFTKAMLDDAVFKALGNNWANETSVKIVVGPEVRILGLTGAPAMHFDAKYGKRPYILVENHGFIAGRGGRGTDGNSVGHPGNDAIRVDRNICSLLRIDNKGTLIGAGGGGGGDYSRVGGQGAPCDVAGTYWKTPMSGSNNGGGGNYSGAGGSWGTRGNSGGQQSGGLAGYALRIVGKKTGDVIGEWVNKGSVYGTAD